MKRLFGNFASVLSSLLVTFTLAHAAQLQEARVTQVVSDVKLLPQQAAPRPAAMNDPVREGTAVRTGTQSRSELTFADQTITRLGANTIFSVNRGTRVMNLGEGAMLFQVPKGSGGATVKTAAITAAITGTTGIGENHSATAENPKPVIKWFCLEGKIVLMLTNGSDESVELLAGQMIVTDGTYLPRPMFFDIGAMVASSPFFDPPPASWDLIQAEIQTQLEERIAGGLIETNTYAALDPAQLVSAIDQGMAAELASSPPVSPTPSTPTPTPSTPTPTPSTPTPTPSTPTPTPSTPTPTPSTPTPTPSTPTPTPSTPTPTPGKFGTLTVIASSDPFVIDSGTVLNTDPTITKAVTTSFGKIYRTSGDDGGRAAMDVWLNLCIR